MKIITLFLIYSICLLANKQIIIDNVTYTIKKNSQNMAFLERKEKNGKLVIWNDNSGTMNLHTILSDSENLYLFCFFPGANTLFKASLRDDFNTLEDNFIEVYPPIEGSPFYGFNFEMVDNKIMISIVGDKEWIKKETNYNNYFYEDKEKLWFPKDNNGNFIYKEARSAIRGWFYDGKLKRWYPAPSYYKGDFNKDLWIEKTPTQEMISFMHQLWNRSMNGEEVDYFAELIKIFKREKERNLFLKSRNIENSKDIQNDNTSNNETDVKILLKTEVPKSNKFIILAILLTTILGGFLIKNRKKKIIKDKNI